MIKYFRKKILRKSKAFTLIEALVSIAVILVAIIGPLTLTLNGLNTIIQNKNRIIASYLGEEIIENLKSYRDSFFISCKSLSIEYNSSGDISGGTCTNGVNLSVSPTYLVNQNGDISYTNRNVAWNLFLNSLVDVLDKKVYLDKTSFNYNNLSNVIDKGSCSISLNTLSGYFCSIITNSNVLTRSVNITKSPSEDSIKVEVLVRYGKSSLYGLNDKYVKVINYIYER